MDFGKILMDAIEGRAPARPLFMPDLGLWFTWHSRRGTLPQGCGGSPAEIAASLNCPAWTVRTPWKLEYEGVEVTRENPRPGGSSGISPGAGSDRKVGAGPRRRLVAAGISRQGRGDLDAAEEIVRECVTAWNRPDPRRRRPWGIEAIEIP